MGGRRDKVKEFLVGRLEGKKAVKHPLAKVGPEGAQSVCDSWSGDGSFSSLLASLLPMVPDSDNVWEGLPLSRLGGCDTLLDWLFQLNAQPSDLRNDQQRLQACFHRNLEEAILLFQFRSKGQRLLNFHKNAKRNLYSTRSNFSQK